MAAVCRRKEEDSAHALGKVYEMRWSADTPRQVKLSGEIINIWKYRMENGKKAHMAGWVEAAGKSLAEVQKRREE